MKYCVNSKNMLGEESEYIEIDMDGVYNKLLKELSLKIDTKPSIVENPIIIQPPDYSSSSDDSSVSDSDSSVSDGDDINLKEFIFELVYQKYFVYLNKFSKNKNAKYYQIFRWDNDNDQLVFYDNWKYWVWLRESNPVGGNSNGLKMFKLVLNANGARNLNSKIDDGIDGSLERYKEGDPIRNNSGDVFNIPYMVGIYLKELGIIEYSNY